MTATPEQIQTAAMLTAMGKSTREIAPIVGRDHTTVWDWLQRHDTQQLITTYRPAIAARLSQRMWQMVDDEAVELSPQQLAIIWGISMDKHDKANQPTAPNNTLVIVVPGLSQPQPLTIDATVTENPQPDNGNG